MGKGTANENEEETEKHKKEAKEKEKKMKKKERKRRRRREKNPRITSQVDNLRVSLLFNHFFDLTSPKLSYRPTITQKLVRVLMIDRGLGNPPLQSCRSR